MKGLFSAGFRRQWLAPPNRGRKIGFLALFLTKIY